MVKPTATEGHYLIVETSKSYLKTEEKKLRRNIKICLNSSTGYNIACGICELHVKQCRLQYRWENLN
jgi:hypothetical protein